eukprot:CAMPEP_0114609212 /NCGR_PEP_ID=MMETSP0168-20121206/2973_1 /TAXON_ID=95228 ORGANISM="Vannella sp., Strain DIVA3 517/6/12" /NCGR_SAMPLE_ID=MMETSP0168 /ASSEMBLY_ACC=CAM_ASM_000044 /LENGTH=100 /DNA_ID=CAMNT_0001820125 /DNA_START=21 /DNA_END=319 /DNA_ORIENTATION=+
MKELLDARENELNTREHRLAERERELEKKMGELALTGGQVPKRHADASKKVVTTCEMTAQTGERRATDALKHVVTQPMPAAETEDVNKLNDLPDDAFLTP